LTAFAFVAFAACSFLVFRWRAGPAGAIATAAPTVEYAWVQLLPSDEVTMARRLVRVILTKGERCPDIAVGTEHRQMHQRPARVSIAFPVLLCEAEIDSVSEATVGQYRLPSRPTEPDAFLVIGDTGCRIVHYETQNCNQSDDAGWPFATVATQAATLLGTYSNPIIVHVGDYHYREKGCPDTNAGCAGSPFGDNWATWKADFYDPVKPLLTAAPWVMIRGNHENCARAGIGYLFFFALPGQQFDGACYDDLAPYRVAIGEAAPGLPRGLAVFDTANANDVYDLQERCDDYAAWAKNLRRKDEVTWLAVRQPLWLYQTDRHGQVKSGTLPNGNCDGRNSDSSLNVIRAGVSAAPDAGDGRALSVILSGDTHMFQFAAPDKQGVPIQIVAGNGGTKLDALHRPGEEATTDGKVLATLDSYGVRGKVMAIAKYGFTILHREKDVWNADLYDSHSQRILVCHFSETEPVLSDRADRAFCGD